MTAQPEKPSSANPVSPSDNDEAEIPPPTSRGSIVIIGVLIVLFFMGGMIYVGVKAGSPAHELNTVNLAKLEPAELVKTSDCYTCHRPDTPHIGPTWVSIAGRYQHNDEVIAELVHKVKNGGKGVWGTVPMTAHPALPEADIERMVRWILDQRAATVSGSGASASTDILPPTSTAPIPAP